MKVLFSLVITLTLFSCNANQSAQRLIDTSRYSVFYRDPQDDRTVFSERIVLTKPMVKDTLQTLLKERLGYINEHFPQSTRVFIYVYKTKADYEKNGFNWISMLSKIDTQNGVIAIKSDLNPENPPEKAEHIEF